VSMVSVGYRWAGLLTAVCGYSLVGVAEAVWSTKPKLFPTCFFKERLSQTLVCTGESLSGVIVPQCIDSTQTQPSADVGSNWQSCCQWDHQTALGVAFWITCKHMVKEEAASCHTSAQKCSKWRSFICF
jgi:hypothetical protein